jgi:hypothetical protein
VRNRRALPAVLVALTSLSVAGTASRATADLAAPHDGPAVVVTAGRVSTHGRWWYTLLAWVRERRSRHLCAELVNRYANPYRAWTDLRQIVERRSLCVAAPELPALAARVSISGCLAPFHWTTYGFVSEQVDRIALEVRDRGRVRDMSLRLYPLPAGLGVAGKLFVVHLRDAVGRSLVALDSGGSVIARQTFEGAVMFPSCPPPPAAVP